MNMSWHDRTSTARDRRERNYGPIMRKSGTPAQKRSKPHARFDRTPEDSAGLLYNRIAGVLRSDIASGVYAVGSSLPSETKLCAKFNVSRHTVRESLRRLAQLGLVARRQGAGTRVIASTPKAAYVHTLRSLFEVFQYTRETKLDIAEISLQPLSSEDAEIVPAPVESRWLRIVGVRRTADHREAICYSMVFVHGRFEPVLNDLREQSGPIYANIEERTGEIVTEARQEIIAAPLPYKAANALRLRTSAPAVRVIRRYLDVSGGPMLTSINWHPADSFKYLITLRRDTND